MLAQMSRFSKLSFGFAVCYVVLISSGALYGQQTEANSPTESHALVGIPDDWTHHHVVFSDPGTASEAAARGRLEEWKRMIADPRYQIQQAKRARMAGGGAPPTVDLATRAERFTPGVHVSPVGPRLKRANHGAWSMLMGGAASITGTVTSNNATSSSSLNIDGVTLDASGPVAATQTGTFTGNPATGQTVTIGGSEVLTASASTPGTGKITVAGTYCIRNGQGITVNGIAITTNATGATATFTISTDPGSGNTITVPGGGTTYHFQSACTTQSYCVVDAGTGDANHVLTAANLTAAINNDASQCGSAAPCFANVSAANAVVSASNTGTDVVTFTQLCAGPPNPFAKPTTTTGDFISDVTAGGAGTTSGANFALPTTVSNTSVATNMATAITNETSSDLVTGSAAGNVVTLTPNTWGSADNAYTLSENASSGVSITAFAGGANGTNTGTYFAVDNNPTDDATNLAAAITRNGGTVGVSGSASGAVVTVTATTAGSSGDSITLAEGLNNFTWAGLTLSGGSSGVQSGTTWTYWSGGAPVSTSQLAANIADTINANTTLQTASTGVYATVSGNVVTVIARTAGTAANSDATTATNFSGITWADTSLDGGEDPSYTPDIFPAKYDFNAGGVGTAAGNCDSAATPDYVVYPTEVTGSTYQPNIIAYDNIYSSCSTSSVPIPNVYWQYNTGGTVITSPVLALDGTQVAFIQETSTPSAQLVLLKWAKNSALQTLTSVSSAAAYTTCTAPCMYTITFAATARFEDGTGGSTTPTTPTDTYSSPFYDYANDALYVGEDNGWLHKFQPVFGGAPAEVSSNWPVQVAVAPLNSPVLDGGSQEVFAGGAVFASNSSAYYHKVAAAGGTVTAYKTSLSATGTDGHPMFYDGALLDSTLQTLYLFVNDDGADAPSAGVWQLDEAFTAAIEAKIGQAANAAGDPIYTGTFDNYYYTNNSVGNLYVCGRNAGGQEPELWKVGINGTTLTPAAVNELTTAAAQCSPVTEFLNGSDDYLYLSVAGSSETARPIFCPSNDTGCLMSFLAPATSAGMTAGATTTATASVAGGTSGIVVDNQSTTAGNSQIYFFPLAAMACAGNTLGSAGTGPCAFQLSQSGLE